MRKPVGYLLVFTGTLIMWAGSQALRQVWRNASRAGNNVSNDGSTLAIYGGLLGVALAIFIGVVIIGIGAGTRRCGERVKAPYATELLATDNRRPIVLLRAFGDDENFRQKPFFQLWWDRPTSSLEESIVASFARIGPVIAVGRPGEWLPPLGAGRLYVEDDWKTEVLDLVQKCRYVVVILGATQGLAWELRQISQLQVIGKVIFVFPPVPQRELQKHWNILAKECLGPAGADIPNEAPSDAVLAVVTSEGILKVTTSHGVRSWKTILSGFDNDHYTKPLGEVLDQLAGPPATINEKNSLMAKIASWCALFIVGLILICGLIVCLGLVSSSILRER